MQKYKINAVKKCIVITIGPFDWFRAKKLIRTKPLVPMIAKKLRSGQA